MFNSHCSEDRNELMVAFLAIELESESMRPGWFPGFGRSTNRLVVKRDHCHTCTSSMSINAPHTKSEIGPVLRLIVHTGLYLGTS